MERRGIVGLDETLVSSLRGLEKFAYAVIQGALALPQPRGRDVTADGCASG